MSVTIVEHGHVYPEHAPWMIHDWDDKQSVTILKHRQRSLGDDERLRVIEQVTPPDNYPSLCTLYDAHMLALSGARAARGRVLSALWTTNLELTQVVPTRVLCSISDARPSQPEEVIRWARRLAACHGRATLSGMCSRRSTRVWSFTRRGLQRRLFMNQARRNQSGITNGYARRVYRPLGYQSITVS